MAEWVLRIRYSDTFELPKISSIQIGIGVDPSIAVNDTILPLLFYFYGNAYYIAGLLSLFRPLGYNEYKSIYKF